MANNHKIQVSNYDGTVEVSQGTVLIQFPMPATTMEGIITKYDIDLSDSAGNKVKIDLHKDPNGNWFDLFLSPINRNVESGLINAAKEKINEMGI